LSAAPLWLPTPGGQAFAWYHAPHPGGQRECAVLLCDPFGWHRMVLHATYRELALRLAAGGFPVLRIDYPGTCDSEGWPRESARVETWLRSLEAGVEHLKAFSGARQVALSGALLGGTLAVMLAARRLDVTALALWGTYLQGRTAVRSELAAAGAATPIADDGAAPGAASGDREAFGFLLTAELIEDLRRVDLLCVPVRNVRRALLLPRAASAIDASRLGAHLAAAGTEVDLRERSRDDLEGVLHAAGAGHPRGTIDDIAAWLEQYFPQRHAAPAATAVHAAEVMLRVGSARLRESAVFLGAGAGIFAIATEPLDRPVLEPAVVLVTGGRNHRSGINRNYTEWARRLGALGHRVLRIDQRGIGDSPPPSGRRDALYSREGRQDVLDAVAWLKARGAGAVACVGLCAGSYQAFHAALAGTSIDALVMLNPLAFHDDRANDTDRPTRLQKMLRRIRRRALKLGKRLFPGARVLARAERRIAASFLKLSERGIDVCIVYNDNEPYLGFLERALLPVRERLAASGRFRIETVGLADHIFSPLAVQARVTAVLVGYIGELAKRSLTLSYTGARAPGLRLADQNGTAIEQRQS
jgi:pimeloyl-ACP methyl ester carboxylesterase